MQGRTHNCGELRLSNAGEQVRLVGWYENIRKVSKNLGFLILRDFYGTTQIVVETEEIMEQLSELNYESTIQVDGVVRERSSKNNKIPTGDIEVVPSKVAADPYRARLTQEIRASDAAAPRQKKTNSTAETTPRRSPARLSVLGNQRPVHPQQGTCAVQRAAPRGGAAGGVKSDLPDNQIFHTDFRDIVYAVLAEITVIVVFGNLHQFDFLDAFADGQDQQRLGLQMEFLPDPLFVKRADTDAVQSDFSRLEQHALNRNTQINIDITIFRNRRADDDESVRPGSRKR